MATRARNPGYVISGILDVQIGDEIYRLEPGDSYLFESHLPHRYHNPGKEVAVVSDGPGARGAALRPLDGKFRR